MIIRESRLGTDTTKHVDTLYLRKIAQSFSPFKVSLTRIISDHTFNGIEALIGVSPIQECK